MPNRAVCSALVLALNLPLAAQSDTGDPLHSGPPRSGTAGPSAPGSILPGAYATQWGSLANAFPFGTPSMRYQQVFLGSELTAPVVVAGVGFREDDQGNRATGGVADLTVKLGLTTFDYNTIGLTSTFDSNYDISGSTVVLEGRVSLPALSGTNGSLATFAVQLPCDAPLVLAPSPGQNILLEVINRSSTNSGFYDKVNANTAVGTTTRIWSTVPTDAAATRGIRNDGLVMCLLPVGTCAPPAFATFGVGCQGSRGVPEHFALGLPQLGTTHVLTLSNAMPSTQAVLFADIQRTMWSGIPLPIRLDFLGATGCTLYVPGTLQVQAAVDVSGSASVSLRVPGNASACGTSLYSQFIVVDPINQLGLVTSNAAESRFGN